MDKTALVLSGGGARGAYQIGVWKALRKLHIKYDIITGTSIGAINGLMMVQNDYRSAFKLWQKIDYTSIFDNDYTKYKGIMLYIKYIGNVIKKGGFKTDNIESIVKKNFNRFKYNHSNIDYGIVTFNLSDLKPLTVCKKDIKDEKIIDYIIASSACFPFFKTKKIDGKNYVDGCFCENMPINLAIEMGANKVIAVDIGTYGVNKKVRDKTVDIKYIVPRNKILSFLKFNKNDISLAIRFGYNDTMKCFDKLDGNKFTFKKGDLLINYNKYINSYMLFKSKYGINKDIDFYEFNNMIEYLGQLLNLDESKIYDIDSFNKEIIKKYNKSNNKIIKNFIEHKSILDVFDNNYKSALYIITIGGKK